MTIAELPPAARQRRRAMASKVFYDCGCMEQGDQYFACEQHKADPIVRPMTYQPTDAGKDRETIKRILRERYEDLAFSPGDAYTRVVDTIAHALADARAEADRDWRQALWLGHGHLGLYGDDGEMQCAMCRPMWDYKRGSIFDTVHAALCAARSEGCEAGRREERERCAKVLDARVERCYELAAGALSFEGKQAWMAEGAQLQGAVDAIRAREEPNR